MHFTDSEDASLPAPVSTWQSRRTWNREAMEIDNSVISRDVEESKGYGHM
jgi:hypothetical protein